MKTKLSKTNLLSNKEKNTRIRINFKFKELKLSKTAMAILTKTLAWLQSAKPKQLMKETKNSVNLYADYNFITKIFSFPSYWHL
jgi:hypothetical protein